MFPLFYSKPLQDRELMKFFFVSVIQHSVWHLLRASFHHEHWDFFNPLVGFDTHFISFVLELSSCWFMLCVNFMSGNQETQSIHPKANNIYRYFHTCPRYERLRLHPSIFLQAGKIRAAFSSRIKFWRF